MARSSTISLLSNLAYTATGEDIYNAIKQVADNLPAIDAVAAGDLQALTAAWNEAQDFTGITVRSGDTASWDGVNKILTVPTVKGDQGVQGDQGTQGIQGKQGPVGPAGPQGNKGNDLTLVNISDAGNGRFTWLFSDGTQYTTPSLTGDRGPRGDAGVSVHHLRATSTTEPHGNFSVYGEQDTYTFYGDAEETIYLGSYTVTNGFTLDQGTVYGFMDRDTYDANGDGIVDNATAVGGKDLATLESDRDVAIQNAAWGLGTVYVVADIAARDALTNLTVADKAHVVDNGDGKWATYIVSATTDGTGANSTFVLTMDQDTLLNANSKELIKAAYELNPDTNAFTDAEKTKVGNISITQLVDLDVVVSDTVLNNTHRTSNGTDHTFIDQDVTTAGTPTFASVKLSGGIADQGVLSWNPDDETIDLVLSPDVTLQIGQEMVHIARNLSGTDLTAGTVIRVTGASGDKVTVDRADSATETTSSTTYGVVTETIVDNGTGRITTSGLVRGLDTSAFTEGASIWLGTNGTFTETPPASPAHLVHIGYVVRVHATVGMILVKVSNGWELGELHNVLTNAPVDGDILQWTAGSNVWENKTLTAAGIQAYNADTVIDASYVHTDNNYTTAEKDKLAGIEAGATADQTKADIDALGIDAATLGGVDITRLSVDELLAAVSQTKGITAVDVFVYNTAKDTDPTWRKRAQATSLYNTTLGTAVRGTRKEYPSIMVLVATATELNIYDGDDPYLPMWAIYPVGANEVVFDAPKSIYALNARICIATGSGLVEMSLLGDSATKYTTGADQTYKASLAVGGAGWI